jgi:hypothetical protein
MTLMTRIEGQGGRLTLDDSYIEFENWSIDENLPIKPGQNYWSGSFRIQEFDYRKILNLWVSNQQIKAEFHE